MSVGVVPGGMDTVGESMEEGKDDDDDDDDDMTDATGREDTEGEELVGTSDSSPPRNLKSRTPFSGQALETAEQPAVTDLSAIGEERPMEGGGEREVSDLTERKAPDSSGGRGGGGGDEASHGKRPSGRWSQESGNLQAKATASKVAWEAPGSESPEYSAQVMAAQGSLGEELGDLIDRRVHSGRVGGPSMGTIIDNSAHSSNRERGITLVSSPGRSPTLGPTGPSVRAARSGKQGGSPPTSSSSEKPSGHQSSTPSTAHGGTASPARPASKSDNLRRTEPALGTRGSPEPDAGSRQSSGRDGVWQRGRLAERASGAKSNSAGSGSAGRTNKSVDSGGRGRAVASMSKAEGRGLQPRTSS